MDVRTYRAPTMQAALDLVRRELGPSAVILHTREVPKRRWLWWRRSPGSVEITASNRVNIRTRLVRPPALAAREPAGGGAESPAKKEAGVDAPAADVVAKQLEALHSMVAGLYDVQRRAERPEVPVELFGVYTDLIEAEVGEELARELVCRLRDEGEDPAFCEKEGRTLVPGPEEKPGTCEKPGFWSDAAAAKARLARLIEPELKIAGPIALTEGTRRVVALVGPTGVGKTTTIAKLAANFRLREARKVGLVTVDTYRIAAVEQLRTYADIIDLPMKVVVSPREMRRALAEPELADADLVLIDTAGRSPRDELKIQELKSFLAEAETDEVHVVLSAVANRRSLQATAEKFEAVGASRLILTKLDEAAGMGVVLDVSRGGKLPLSYVTAGQSVPDDIEPAERGRLARLVVGTESVFH